MGRCRALATVACGFDSSPFSAESSFRELDDVFLQTQTRIWLGEVLNTRLDEQLDISDLLADGEHLFEVSKLVWNLLLAKCVELRHVKAYQALHGSRKSSGRYMPYSNVDTFLKICKILGLNGIDLFSPSDVVEKRDIRKVCICIRALSKKARSKQLNVPDFDVVSYTVSMPTEMVGCIRRSLESSLCSFSSSSSYSSHKDRRSKHQQTTLISEVDGNYDSSSDESDEAESKYVGIETSCSSLHKFDDAATLNSCTEDSSDAFSAIKPCTSREIISQSDTRNLYTTNLTNGEPMSLCSLQSMNSLSSSLSTSEHHANNLASCHIKPQLHLHSMHSHVNIDQANSFRNSLGVIDVNCAQHKEASSFGNSLFEITPERDFISDYLAFSDSVVLGANSSSFFDGEGNICNFFMGFDSHHSDTSQRTFQAGFHQKSTDDMEDVEVSSCTSMTSILGRVLSMDFDDQFDAGDSPLVKVHFCGPFEQEADSQDRGSSVEDPPLDVAQFETSSHISDTDDVIESQYEMKLERDGFCHEFLSTCRDRRQPPAMLSSKHELYGCFQEHPGDTFSLGNANLARSENDKEIPTHDNQHAEILDVTCERLNKSLDGIHSNEDFISLANGCKSSAETQPSFVAKDLGHMNEAGQIESTNCHKKERGMPVNQENLSESISGGREHPNGGLQKDKLRRRPLLKTVVRGTALVGVVFLLLHISRRGRGRTDDDSKQSSQTRNFSGAKSSSEKGQSRRSNGAYPAQKLNFGK